MDAAEAASEVSTAEAAPHVATAKATAVAAAKATPAPAKTAAAVAAAAAAAPVAAAAAPARETIGGAEGKSGNRRRDHHHLVQHDILLWDALRASIPGVCRSRRPSRVRASDR
jgi:hypothetical protein